MSFFEWAVILHLLDNSSSSSKPAQQTNTGCGICFWSALLFVAAAIAFFKSLPLLAAVLLGLSVFVFWYYMILYVSSLLSLQSRLTTAFIAFVFLAFTIAAAEVYLFTDAKWLFKPIFWTGVVICAIYLVSKLGR